ncbi:MAG TPA: Uma2 family endonuclease [Kofleriaceae bacterium]|nr:Uma2 family endonuclease [Kofleriaceae bacterium]
MAKPAKQPDVEEDMVLVPASAVFPIEVKPPACFDPDDLRTWPDDPGRFEYVDGRLLYMPPCGEIQSAVAADVMYVLGAWQRQHPDFVVGGNEAGLAVGDNKYGLDGAVWRRDDVGQMKPGFSRVPPILAVEVAGARDKEVDMARKAVDYVQHGVRVVWLVMPESGEVVVFTRASMKFERFSKDMSVAPVEELPGLAPAVTDFFRQLG